MFSERNRPARVEIRVLPKRVRNAAYEWCRGPDSRPQNSVLHLDGGLYDDPVLVEETGGPVRWHDRRRRNPSRGRTPDVLFSSARTLVARPPGTPGLIRFDACKGGSVEGVRQEHAAGWNRIRGMGRELDWYRNLTQRYGMPY